MPYCLNCGNESGQSAKFCIECGTPSGQVARPQKRPLMIRRESQVVCAGNSYDVIVDGVSHGNLPAGKTMVVDVYSDEATVTVKSTTILIKAQRTVRLKLGNHPILTYSLQWPGTQIIFTYQDAAPEG